MLIAAGLTLLGAPWLVTDMEALAVRSVPALGAGAAAAAAAADGAAAAAAPAAAATSSSALTNNLFSYLALIHLSRTIAKSYSFGLM